MVEPIKVKHRAKEEKRYAIYYAPEDDSSLDTFGQTWLGRDVRSGNSLVQPQVEGISSQKLKKIVSAAAHYGFYGTLKPPFYLKRPNLERHLFEDIALFALKQTGKIRTSTLFKQMVNYQQFLDEKNGVATFYTTLPRKYDPQ